MLDFANKSNPYTDVKFLHMDITNITEYPQNSFDYSIMWQVIHELSAGMQLKAMSELARIGKKVLVVDWNSPLHQNALGLAARIVEATFGRDHYLNFRSYVASGGILGILSKAGLTSNIIQQLIFRHNCQQVVILTAR